MSKKLKDIELRSEQVQDILSYIPHWMIRYGNLLFFILIILSFGLSWIIKYPDVIHAEVLITTTIPPQREFANTSGKLEAILITDNAYVYKNQPLAVIQNTANHEDVYTLKATLDTIEVNNKSFYFPIHELPVLFLGDIDVKFALFENNYIQYKLNESSQAFYITASGNANSISELNKQLQDNKEQLKLNINELRLKKRDFESSKNSLKKGVISKIEFEQKQKDYNRAEINLKSTKSSIILIKESISNIIAPSKDIQVNKTKEDIMLLKSVIQSFKQLKNAITAWEAKHVLKSNIDGKVVFSNYWRVNETVNQGDLIFTVIPNENSYFIAKLRTPAANSGKLKIGQQVNIKLENYPETEFGTLQAKVNYISSIADDNGNYLILSELPKKLITSYKKEIKFKQEMRGTAEIITEDLRLAERFFYQVKDIFK